MTMTNTRARMLAYLLILSGGVLVALCLGKDLNWDSLSYHAYAGFNAVEHRLGVDYFAASTQGYLNPYAHVPFYLMLKQGLAPQAIVALLALFHLLNLLIVFEMAVLLNKRADGAIAWLPVACAVTFAILNPVFLLELGNTFNEITTSVPVLAGWYLLMRDFALQRPGRMVLAGVLIGAAVSLKMTNLLFSVTALPLLLLAPTAPGTRARAVLCFALGGLLGVLLAGAWWGWQLWELFGNPVFPLLNQYFHSPEFTDGALKHYRFLSDSGLDTLLKPFLLSLPMRGVHLETVAVDLRFAAIVLLLGLFGVKAAFGGVAGGKWLRADPFPFFQGRRLCVALGAALLLAWTVWVTTSGNSRYFLPMSSVAAVVLASLLFRFSAKLRFLAYAAGPLLLLQAGVTVATSEHRWTPTAYGKQWFEVAIPAPLQQQPTLFLNLNTMPASFLLPFLPRASSMISVTGMYVLEENARLRALFTQYQGNVRVMRRYGGDKADDKPDAKQFNYALVKFGMEVDMTDCQTMKMTYRGVDGQPDTVKNYIACKAKPLQWSAAQRAAYLESKRRSDAVFAGLEKLCPQLFQPHGLASEGDGRQFWRNYFNTDTVLQQYESGLVTYRNVFNHSQDVPVGMIEALAKALPPKDKVCPDEH
jgi:hypothetical protein